MQQLAASITERSRTLINNDLKKICKEEGMPVTGNKAGLQSRVFAHINNAVLKNDTPTLQRMLYRVQNHGEAPPPAAATTTTSSSAIPSYSHMSAQTNGYSMANGYQNKPSYPSYPPPPPTSSRPQYFFKESPFFEIRELILGNISLDASPSHRQNCSRPLALNESVCTRLKSDPSLRLLLFGALEQPLAPYTRCDIAFPSQIEVRINNEEIRANYKGLKNKPGSTRPVDVTDFVRKSPANYRNQLLVTYALTQKRYNLFIYLVKKFSVDELTQRIKQRNVITRESVLSEMMKKANDPDIEVGSSVMSLKDPISTLRISTPCRSTLCTHNQCFDAESFLQLQEQAPTWTCPICNKSISYEALAVDAYVEEILRKARNADQVTIQPNGEWSLEREPSPPRRNGYNAHDDSDDDLVDITDYRDRISAIKHEAAPTPVSLSTPPLPSRDSSTAPRSGTKRPSEVVDLTLSDDDEPPRPAKKVAYSPNASRRFHVQPPANSAAQGRPPPPLSYPSPYPNSVPDHSRPTPTAPDRPGYNSYRLPAPFPPPPGSRPGYPGQGTAQYPAYLGSSP